MAVVTAFALFLAFPTQAASVKGMLSGATDGKYIYIYKLFGFEATKLDSAKVSKGEFVFKQSQAWPRGLYRIGFGDPAQDLTLVLCNEDIEIEATSTGLANANIKKSVENEAWLSYQHFKADINSKTQTLENNAQQLEGLKAKSPQAYESALNKLIASYDSLQKTIEPFTNTFAENHPKLFMGKVAEYYAIKPTTNRQNYFRKSDFTDPEFARGNMVLDKINTYYQKFVPKSADEYIKAADEIIAHAPAGSEGRELAFGGLIQFLSQADQGITYKFAKKYVTEFPKSERAKKLLAKLPPPPPEIGDVAPEIQLPDRNGKPFALSSLKGQVVLIDFWASWCGPCRAENPNVVRAYSKYKSKGFTVLSVSLDQAKDKWLAAIEKDGLFWPNHISDLKAWQCEGAKKYSVNSIPATFLVDKQGKIIGKNLRGPDLEEKLEKVLNVN